MTMSDTSASGGSHASPPEKLLTVVIPHYNHKAFLPRVVASVLSGQSGEIEIIVVDDGSTDGSEPTLAALEARSPLITVIRCETNQGVTAALNTGLAAARCRYVTFLAADDLAMADLYLPLLRALQQHPAAALACSQLVIVGSDGALRGVRPITPPAFRTEYLDPATILRRVKHTDHWISSTTAVFRTDLLRAAGGFDNTLGVFCDIIVARLLAFQYGFVYVPGIRGIFRVAPSTLSGTTLLDQNKNTRQLEVARQRLATSIVGKLAPDYPDLFARRMQFSAGRLQLVWHGQDADPAAIVKVAGGRAVDMRVLTAIRSAVGFGKIGRILALGWLTLRLRPFSPWLLIVHLLRNRSALNRNRQRVTDWLHQMDAAGRELIAGSAAERVVVADAAPVSQATPADALGHRESR
jgi:glycosyltransferase involved in cell wall biosynthesis